MPNPPFLYANDLNAVLLHKHRKGGFKDAVL
jgi:hypothetical protein